MADRRLNRFAGPASFGLLGAILVYVAYYPSDSVAVERGDAWVFVLLSLGLMMTSAFVATVSDAANTTIGSSIGDEIDSHRTVKDQDNDRWHKRLIKHLGFDRLDVCLTLLAIWISIAAMVTGQEFDLRQSTNEAWLWISAATLIIAVRRMVSSKRSRSTLWLIVIMLAVVLAIQAIYQDQIGLPQTRQLYRDNPDKMLSQVGIDAPAGSSLRMVFENRLFDGGPSATFALANSLAAVLVFAWVGSAGFIRYYLVRHSKSSISDRGTFAAWIFVFGFLSWALIAVRSRSAIGACLVGLVILYARSTWLQRDRSEAGDLSTQSLQIQGGRNSMKWLAWLAVPAAAATASIVLLGNAEWIEQAPASLQFRFQYWQSTVGMVLDRPIFGAGPGNYQAIYDQYRQAATTEQIADPHNFLFETLAAGGPIALILLFAMVVFAFIRRPTEVDQPVSPSDLLGTDFPATASRKTAKKSQAKSMESDIDDSSVTVASTILAGAGVMLLLIWVIGLAFNRLPDNESHWFAVPIGMACGWFVRVDLNRSPDCVLDQITFAALMGLLVHLLIAGGWTVPGVAVLVWLGFSMLTRKASSKLSQKNASDHDRSPALAALGSCLTLLLVFVSIRPSLVSSINLQQARTAQVDGLPAKAERLIQSAVDADSWSGEAAVTQAEFYHWQFLFGEANGQDRSQWLNAIDLALIRSGRNPSVYRQLTSQCLHAYQVHGEREDLDSALRYAEEAADLSPANQFVVAQLSEIVRATGDVVRAKQLAEQAKQLSELGGNLERALYLQLIYVARPIGRNAISNPVRQPADKQLLL